MAKRIKRRAPKKRLEERFEKVRRRSKKTEKRVKSLEVIIGMDEDTWPVPDYENVEIATPLGVVLAELGLTEEEQPLFKAWLKNRIEEWRSQL